MSHGPGTLTLENQPQPPREENGAGNGVRVQEQLRAGGCSQPSGCLLQGQTGRALLGQGRVKVTDHLDMETPTERNKIQNMHREGEDAIE